MARIEQNHIYTVYDKFGREFTKSIDIYIYTVYIYGSGQPCIWCYSSVSQFGEMPERLVVHGQARIFGVADLMPPGNVRAL
jgi:hypothetical protein